MVSSARLGGLLCVSMLCSVVLSSPPPPPPSSSSSSPLPSSSSSTPDSVYATSGFMELSPLNRVALVATVIVFLLLSALSGRELYLQRYGRARAAANANAPASTGHAANGANGTKHSFTTPKHYSVYGSSNTNASAPQAVGVGVGVGASTSSALLDDESGAALSTGAEMRQRFFALLFAASTIRVVALVVEITTLNAMETSPAASLYSRLLSMFLWLPALLFVSMYGLVLLFWAQLCYACWGKFHPWPRRVFFAFNVLLYVVFVVLLLATGTSGAFWRACDVMLGAIYLLGFLGILYYSVRLAQFFRNQGPDEEFFFDLPANGQATAVHRRSPRQIVLHRIMAVCVLLSVLFVAKAAYLIGLGVGFVPSEETQYRTPVGVHHIAFEFAMHFFTEFVPCAVLLLVTRKQNQPALSPATQSGGITPGLGQGQGTTPANGGLPPHFGLRGRNNSSHSAYQDDTHSVGSGSLTGYQFQAVQRSYGSTLTNALRSTPTTTTTTSSSLYQSVDSV